MSNKFTALTPANFEDFKQQDGLVVVIASASWCGPCRLLKYSFERVLERPEFQALPLRVGVVSLDDDANKALAVELGVTSIPTTFIYQRGRDPVGFIGAIGESAVIDVLNRALAGEGQPKAEETSTEGSDVQPATAEATHE